MPRFVYENIFAQTHHDIPKRKHPRHITQARFDARWRSTAARAEHCTRADASCERKGYTQRLTAGQSLPAPVLYTGKPTLKLGLDVHLEFIVAVARKRTRGLDGTDSPVAAVTQA